MSQTEKNIAKHLIVGLIYPAVLGTLIYSLFDTIITSIVEQEAKGFLSDEPIILIFKSILVLGTIGFYCCDFIYTIFTKDFKTRYFFFDLVILIGLSVTFKAINIDNNLLPNLNVILLSFLSFMFFYFLWDYFEIGNKQGRQSDAESKFYKKMVSWEIFSSIGILLIWLLFKLNWLSYTLILFTTTIAIGVITSFFVILVRKKRNFLEN